MERSVLADTRHVHWNTDLHSEYRSTYRWHEHKEQQKQQGVVKQPAPTPPNALPLTRGPMEPAMHRRKKYPGVAYKSNELFDPVPVDDIRPQQTSAFDRARSTQRNDADRAGRRSKSEGPRQPRWTDTVEPKATTALGDVVAAKEPEMASTEYQNQFAWPKDTTDSVPRKSISMGALKKAAVAEGSVEAEPLMNHVDDHDDGHKRYIEDYLWNGQKPGVQRKSTFRSALSALISNGEDRSKDNRKRYKSEYKKKFRPFSQYVYEASKGTFTKCRGKGKTTALPRCARPACSRWASRRATPGIVKCWTCANAPASTSTAAGEPNWLQNTSHSFTISKSSSGTKCHDGPRCQPFHLLPPITRRYLETKKTARNRKELLRRNLGHSGLRHTSRSTLSCRRPRLKSDLLIRLHLKSSERSSKVIASMKEQLKTESSLARMQPSGPRDGDPARLILHPRPRTPHRTPNTCPTATSRTRARPNLPMVISPPIGVRPLQKIISSTIPP